MRSGDSTELMTSPQSTPHMQTSAALRPGTQVPEPTRFPLEVQLVRATHMRAVRISDVAGRPMTEAAPAFARLARIAPAGANGPTIRCDLAKDSMAYQLWQPEPSLDSGTSRVSLYQ